MRPDLWVVLLDGTPLNVSLTDGPIVSRLRDGGERVHYVPAERVAEEAKARVDRDRDQAIDNLTSCQKRCTELLEEVRSLREQAKRHEGDDDRPPARPRPNGE